MPASPCANVGGALTTVSASAMASGLQRKGDMVSLILLDRDALGEVPGPVHITATQDGDVIGEQLQGNHGQNGRQQRVCGGDPELVVGERSGGAVGFGRCGGRP